MRTESSPFRFARVGFLLLAWLFSASVALQVFLAGLALFVDSSNWSSHMSFARYFSFLPLLMAVLARTARLPSRLIWRCIGLFGMILGLFLTAIFSSRIGGLAALHPVIALLLFWVSLDIIRSKKQQAQ
ncbi:DUF6220 domain-containing protein [Paenibacillus ihbetae]|uniref:DUF4345 domain-containing protein n=1 Tax=Paenibacillus ihbetae TaxID=1870820 RepID=A0ABX3JMJ3_9BACL|nr:DUF6220 domain-containing protein [Paenibacillus ihbetae]OOC57580.1 hypothetical protein BBD40_28130 [Paenibacillus ihbetae]